MRENRVSPEENQPIWTVADNLTSVQVDTHLPSYDQYIVSNLELAIVPDGNNLHYSQIIPFQQPSKAKVERKNGIVSSSDSLIHQNANQLWLYFMTYLQEKPHLILTIFGYHYEYHNYRYRYDHTDRSRMITDFKFSIDLTSYISDHYHHIEIVSKNNTTENFDLKDLLEQYIQSNKRFKEIFCLKRLIGWDLNDLERRIKRLIISSTGYRSHIQVNVSIKNSDIIAHSSSKLYRYSKSIWMRLLCFLTCLCIIFHPIYHYLHKTSRINHHIVADYQIISTIDSFLERNSRLICKAIMAHSKEHFRAVTV